jgi:cytochrome oxidase assembly protein ShyY1
VRVEGVLRPTESAVERAPGQSAGLPPGQIDRVDVNALVQRWPYPLFTGFVLLTDQAPAPPGPALALVPPVTSTDSGLDLRNLSYALQWWLFAAFGLFFWWRVVRDDHQGRTSPDDAPAEAAQADGAPVTTPSRGAQP